MSLYAYRRFVASEHLCRLLWRQLPWPRGLRCPAWEGRRIWRRREGAQTDYRCRRCGRHFSDTAGTVFAKTRTPLAKWVLVIGLFRVGISAQGLPRELAVGYQTAWKMLMAIRAAIAADPLLERLAGRVEVDETYCGGRQKGKRGRGAAHKTPGVGLRERGGRVRSLVVPNVASPTLRAAIRAAVAAGAIVYTDQFRGYTRVRADGYRHRRLDHGTRLVRGQTHTQTIEGYWGHVKPQLVARHRSVSPRHLSRYLAEADFKFNARKDSARSLMLVFPQSLTRSPSRTMPVPSCFGAPRVRGWLPPGSQGGVPMSREAGKRFTAAENKDGARRRRPVEKSAALPIRRCAGAASDRAR